MLTLINAWRNIQLGDSSVVLCGGVEVMSRTPYYLMDARWGARMGHKKVVDGMYLDGFHCPLSDQLMGATAETLAERWQISREAQDAWAVESQRRAAVAQEHDRQPVGPLEAVTQGLQIAGQGHGFAQ